MSSLTYAKLPLIPENWKRVLRDIQREFPEACIAGGALRDLYMQKTIKDIDIWVRAREYDVGGKLGDALIDVKLGECTGALWAVSGDANHQSTLSESELGGPKVMQVYEPAGFMKYDTPPVQVMAVSVPADDKRNFCGVVIDRFDFGICRIGYDGKDWRITSEFFEDVAKKKFTFLADDRVTKESIAASMIRFERLRDKYPEFECDMRGKDAICNDPVL